MSNLTNDLRFGARLVRKSPAMSFIAILALTLGIGLTATMFSIVYGALIRGLPFDESERLVHVEGNNLERDQPSLEVSVHDYMDWRAQQRSFEALGAFYMGTINVTGPEKPERYSGAFITPNSFRLLRVQPLMGRLLQDSDDELGAPPVILLGHRVWQELFASDPDIVGKSIRAMGETRTVVGVMAEDFKFPVVQDVWVPLKPDPLKNPRGEGQTLEVFGRLKPGVSIDQAMVEFTAIAKRLAVEHPKTNKGVGVVMKPYVEEYLGDEPRTLLFTMLGAVFLVLLVACANVANLLLSRAAQRSREVAIRTALGASRWRVVVQFLSESFVLAAIGAVLGTLLAWLGVRAFNAAIAGTDPPFWIDIKLDLPVLAFTVLVTLVASIVAGVLPALAAARANVNDILKDESRGASSFRIGRLSRALVVFEIALSCGLLVAAGLTIKSVVKLRTVDFGFPTENVLTARVGLPENEYPDSASQAQFWEQLLPRVRQIPGVAAATIATSAPGLGSYGVSMAVEGVEYKDEDSYPSVNYVVTAPGYFETYQKQILEGRALSEQDRYGTLPVALVNESFVKKFFAGQSPIGRRIRFGGDDQDEPWLSIVGVVPDMHLAGFDDDDEEAGFYVPVSQRGQRFMTVMLRSSSPDATALTPQIRAAVSGVDPDLPIYFVNTVQAAFDDEAWFFRVFGTMFMIFGFVALFLAGIGLYGVMSSSVAQRTREVGVRMALGAQPAHVLRLVFRQGMIQLAIGLLLGLGLAAGVSRLLTVILFDVNPRDPLVFGAIVAVLSAATALACFVPARRATRVDPVVALRYE